ncbi:MAG TPA: hypothetical protein VMU75_05375 [Acidimicrobiales bacterium]|nr:hypothetical protein [Acidimicrobiales bacterium]
MAQDPGAAGAVAERLRRAYSIRDLDALASCSPRTPAGATATVRTGAARAPTSSGRSHACPRAERTGTSPISSKGRTASSAASRWWPEGDKRPGGRAFLHVYLVRGGRITEIQCCDDRGSAAEAAGIRG